MAEQAYPHTESLLAFWAGMLPASLEALVFLASLFCSAKDLRFAFVYLWAVENGGTPVWPVKGCLLPGVTPGSLDQPSGHVGHRVVAGVVCCTALIANWPENGMLQYKSPGHEVDVQLGFVTSWLDTFNCINVHIVRISCSMECIVWNKHIWSYLKIDSNKNYVRYQSGTCHSRPRDIFVK